MKNEIDYVIQELYKDFRERSKEVKDYTNLIQVMASTKATGLAKDSIEGIQAIENFEFGRDLTKTIRASGYLLIYNLVESTLSNAIDSIHKAIDIDKVEYNSLNSNLRKIVLSHFSRVINNKEIVVEEKPIQIVMVSLGYYKEQLFSGNIDCREMAIISKKYGFSIPSPKLGGRAIGDLILEVKTKRNDLAHGSISFEMCGRETAPEHLAKISYATILYLRAIIWAVSFFIRSEGYLKAGE